MARSIRYDLVADPSRWNRGFRDAERSARRFQATTKTFGKDIKKVGDNVTKLGRIWKLIKPAAIIAGLQLGAVATEAFAAASISLVAALAPLTGALPVLGVGALALGQAMGVLKLVFSGMGQAVTTVAQTTKGYQDQLKQLQAAGRDVAKQLVPFATELLKIRTLATRGILPGLTSGLQSARALFPVVEKAVYITAVNLGILAQQAGRLLGSGPFRRDFAALARGNVQILSALGSAALALAPALLSIAVAAQPVTIWLARLVEGWARAAASFIQGARASGSLERFFGRTKLVIAQLIDIIFHLGRALVPVFSGASAIGRGFLITLDQLVRRFDQWTHSAAGRNSIKKFFDESKPVIEAVGRLIASIANSFKGLGKGFSPQLVSTLDELSKTFVPAIAKLAQNVSGAFIKNLTDLASNIARILSATGGNTGSLTTFVGNMAKLTGALANFLDKHPAIGSFVTNILTLAAISKATGLSSLAGSTASLASSFISLKRNQGVFKQLQALAAGEGVSAKASVWSKLGGWFKSAMGGAIGLAATLATPFAAAVAGAVLVIAGLVALIIKFPRQAASFGSAIGGIFGKLLGPLPGIARLIYRHFGDIVTAVRRLPGQLSGAWTAVAGWFRRLPGSITGFFRGAGNWLAGPGRNLITGLWNGIKGLWRSVQGWFGGLNTTVNRYLARAGGYLTGKGRDLITGLWNGVKALWRNVQGWFGQVNRFVNSYLARAGGYLTGKGRDLITGLWNGIKTLWRNVQGWFGQVNRFVNSYLARAGGYLTGKGRDLITGLWNGVKALWRSVQGWFGGINGFVNSYLARAGGYLTQKGKDIINGLWNGLKNVWNTVKGWFGGLPKQILDALGIHSPPQWALDAGTHIMNGILKKLAHGAGDVKGFFQNLAGDVGGPLKAVWAKVTDWIPKGIWSKVSNFASSIGGFIGSLFKGGGNLGKWIAQALAITHTPANWAGPLSVLVMRESGGNPNAINRSDINAQRGDPSRGLAQTIGATFRAFHQAGTSGNIFDPVANLAAAINYIKSRYGSIFRVQQANPNLPPRGYAKGAWDVLFDQIAMIHKGEMVVPRKPAEQIRRGASGGGGSAPMYVTVHVHDATDPQRVGQVVVAHLDRLERKRLMLARQGGRV